MHDEIHVHASVGLKVDDLRASLATDGRVAAAI